MASVSDRLATLVSDPSLDQKTRIEHYKALLAELFTAPDTAELRTFVEHVTSEEVALVISRQVLQEIAAGIKPLPAPMLKEVGTLVLDRIQPRVTSFEEQASTVREHLADVYEREEEWSMAAKLLAGIPLDSGIRVLEDNYKVRGEGGEREGAEKPLAVGRVSRGRASHLTATCPLTCPGVPAPSARVPSLTSGGEVHKDCDALPARRGVGLCRNLHQPRLPPSYRGDERPLATAAQGVLRTHPRCKAQVPRGCHALLPAFAADHPHVRRHE